MSFTESVLLAGLVVNTLGLGVILFKLVWGGGTSLQTQFRDIEKSLLDHMNKLQADWQGRMDAHSTNIGNVAMNMSDRFHRLELAAMESRAIAAETYMRRDSYHKATDEFKRDVREANDDLKREIESKFNEIRVQIDAVSQSIEANRRSSARERV